MESTIHVGFKSIFKLNYVLTFESNIPYIQYKTYFLFIPWFGFDIPYLFSGSEGIVSTPAPLCEGANLIYLKSSYSGDFGVRNGLLKRSI